MSEFLKSFVPRPRFHFESFPALFQIWWIMDVFTFLFTHFSAHSSQQRKKTLYASASWSLLVVFKNRALRAKWSSTFYVLHFVYLVGEKQELRAATVSAIFFPIRAWNLGKMWNCE